jgi:predicted DNA-binding mobile mystery protein A
MATRSSAALKARKSLDLRLREFGPARRYQAPPSGWVRAIRDALGLSASELGRRMGVSGPAVSGLERNEKDGTVRLDTLRRAAASMDCTFVYLFIPNEGLEQTVRTAARRAARAQLARVAGTMALEDQAVAVDEDMVEAHAEALIAAGRVWSGQR